LNPLVKLFELQFFGFLKKFTFLCPVPLLFSNCCPETLTANICGSFTYLSFGPTQKKYSIMFGVFLRKSRGDRDSDALIERDRTAQFLVVGNKIDVFLTAIAVFDVLFIGGLKRLTLLR
jgi:hypothetical protein